MKKVLMLCFAIMALMLGGIIFAGCGDKDIKNSDGFVYVAHTRDNAIIIGYKGEETDIVFPSKIEGQRVTHVGKDGSDNFFDDPKKITSITFQSAADLTSYNMITILPEIFNGCTSLKSIVIPEKYMLYDGADLRNCSALESFEHFSNISQQIGFPNSLKTIKLYNQQYIGESDRADISSPYRFEGLANLESVYIPNVEEIGKNTFKDCVKLSKVETGASLKKIGAGAFENCSSLSNFEIVDGCDLDITALTSTPLMHKDEKGCTYFGKQLLKYDGDDKEVVIDSSTTKIFGGAFSGKNIEKLTIPFVGEKLDGTGNPTLQHIFGWGVPESLKKLVISGGVIVAGALAYSGISEIEIGAGVNIEEGALSGCYPQKLTVPYLSETFSLVSLFGSDSPYNLEHIIVKGGSTIEDRAFKGLSNLVSVTLPNTITKIGYDAFERCDSLASINFAGTESQWYNIVIGEGSDISVSKKFKFSIYEDFGIIESSSGITITAYLGLERDVVIPSKLKNKDVIAIGDEAFEGMKKITSITIPNSIKKIGEHCFKDCSFEEIVVPNSVIEIGFGALRGCSVLKKVSLPFTGRSDGREQSNFGQIFGSSNFTNGENVPKSLKSVVITLSTVIYSFAFEECEYIEEITLSRAYYIESAAFTDCTGLKNVKFLNSQLSFIEGTAFQRCNNFEKAYFAGTESQWSAIKSGTSPASPILAAAEKEYDYSE